MPRKQSEHLTPLELEIMKVLWETGPANVQTVLKALDTGHAYTTVQTMLGVLHRKGRVSRTLRDKAYVYEPTESRRAVIGKAVGDLVERMFGGSAESLVMSLVEERHITPEKLARLNALIEKEAGREGDQ